MPRKPKQDVQEKVIVAFHVPKLLRERLVHMSLATKRPMQEIAAEGIDQVIDAWECFEQRIAGEETPE